VLALQLSTLNGQKQRATCDSVNYDPELCVPSNACRLVLNGVYVYITYKLCLQSLRKVSFGDIFVFI
jgi:hypothetical protein